MYMYILFYIIENIFIILYIYAYIYILCVCACVCVCMCVCVCLYVYIGIGPFAVRAALQGCKVHALPCVHNNFPV